MSKSKKMDDIFITREDLRSYIHGIHNFLRNNGAGYGQAGMKIFSVFYGLKLIQPHLDKLKLSKEQKEILDFNNLVKKAKATGEITEYIIESVLGVLFELRKGKNDFGKFIFYEIPRDLKDNIWKELILKIDKLPVGYREGSKVNLSGKVWEYFVGRDDTAISELGAYFTDRHITDFIFNKLKPELDEDDNIKTMIDPFGGSGGFTLGYANYLRENFDEIDWKKNVNSIYHYDMEESVVNMTGLEMFAITGEFPKVDSNKNFKRQNSFTNGFYDKEDKYRYFDYIITNPPYGGDKVNKNAEQLKRDKTLAYLKNIKEKNEVQENQIKCINKENDEYKKEQAKHQVNLNTCSDRIRNFAKKYKLDNANDKEACSLILLMDLLAENGICCGVLKEGVFFDGKYSKLREVLINNYNVTDVISVPQNAFENTSTKTSIVIFKNNGKTKKINFSELIVNLEEEDIFDIDETGYVRLTENKGEIKDVIEKQICTATYNQVSEPTITKKGGKENKKYDFSLNYKNYKDIKVYCPDGYELKKLGDICEIIDGYAFKSNDFTSNGVSIIQISNINNYKIIDTDNDKKVNKNDKYNKYLANNDDIIIGMTGNIQEKIAIYKKNNQDKYLNQRTCALRNFENNLTKNYIYSYWIFNKLGELIQNKSNGSVQKNLSKEDLKNIQIPIPIDLTKIKKPLESLQKLHQQISQDTESIPQKEKEICDLIKKLTDEGKEGVEYDSYKIGEISDLVDGYDFYKKDMDSNKCYKPDINLPIIKNNGGVMCDYVIINDKYNKYIANKNDILISTAGTCGRVIKLNFEKGYHAHHMPRFIDIKINKNYLYYYILLTFDSEYIKNNTHGSVLGHLKMETIKNTTIKVLKPSIMKKYKLEELFDEVDNLKEQLETNKKDYQGQINKLFKDFKEDDKPENEDINESIEEESEEEPEYETIEHKGKEYYLDGKKVYRIKKNGEKGDYYGKYKNGEVIKSSEENNNKDDKKVIVKAKK